MSKKPSLPGADALFGGPPAKEFKVPEKVTTEEKKEIKKVQTINQENKKTDNQTSKKTRKHVNIQVRKQENKIVDKHGTKKETSGRKRGKEKTEELTRYTLYFTEDLLDKLESSWLRLRKKHKVPKWKIVNLLLEEHLGDVGYIENLLEMEKEEIQ